MIYNIVDKIGKNKTIDGGLANFAKWYKEYYNK
ncbi:MAG: hypothetical protein PWP28_1653 [Oceanotoga sp.]|jgi:hypothetical protein|nr:hypothetical protein [Oceanotoga sp.]